MTALVGALLLPLSASGADQDNHWHLNTSLNLFAAGMSGDVAVKGQTAHLDPSFSDIFDQLEAAAAGRVALGYDRWFLSTEFSYLKLGADANAADVELKQWLVEPTLGYQFCENFAAFAGVRYNSIEADIDLNGPFDTSGGGTKDWWDPIVGAQVSLSLIRKKLSLEGRFDIGGFDVASELTWQAYPYLNWRFTKWGSAQLGYRWLGTDYQTGSGASEFRYDVVLQGPQIGITIHF